MAAAMPLLGGVMSVSAKFAEYLVPPIKRQFSYMFCYSKNMKDLENQGEVLGDKHTGVKRLVDAAKRNLQIIGPDVEKWLSEVEKIRQINEELQEKKTKVSKSWICGSCPNLKLRYKLSRRAKKVTKKCLQLQEKGQFECVSYPPAPGEAVSYPVPPLEKNKTVMTTPTEPGESSRSSNPHDERIIAAGSLRIIEEVSEEKNMFEVTNSSAMTTEIEVATFETENRFRSRKIVEETLLAALQNHNVIMIGLCGMGGVEKPTTARRIEKIIKENKMFDVVVMVVVTHQLDSRNIQNQIAEVLGLTLDSNNLWARATRLHNRIMNEKDILIILDDIWERLDLREIGIPNGTIDCPCKFLLTSRTQDVCVQMGADEILPPEVLSLEEAWTLFSEEAGIPDESCYPYLLEKEVANECNGLPIALISVARALKGKRNTSWEDALVQLKRSQQVFQECLLMFIDHWNSVTLTWKVVKLKTFLYFVLYFKRILVFALKTW